MTAADTALRAAIDALVKAGETDLADTVADVLVEEQRRENVKGKWRLVRAGTRKTDGAKGGCL